MINLDVAISNDSYVSAYAFKEVYSEEEKIYTVALGTNDGGRLWINGVEVWDYPGARGLKPDDNLIPVLFKKGKNTVLWDIIKRRLQE